MIQYLQELETIKAVPLDSKTYKLLSQQKYLLQLTTNAEIRVWENENDEN